MVSVLVVLACLFVLASLWFNAPVLAVVAGVLLLLRITNLLEEVACWLCFHCRLLDPRDGDPRDGDPRDGDPKEDEKDTD